MSKTLLKTYGQATLLWLIFIQLMEMNESSSLLSLVVGAIAYFAWVLAAD